LFFFYQPCRFFAVMFSPASSVLLVIAGRRTASLQRLTSNFSLFFCAVLCFFLCFDVRFSLGFPFIVTFLARVYLFPFKVAG